VTTRINGILSVPPSPVLHFPQGFRPADTGGVGYGEHGWGGWGIRNRGQQWPYSLSDGTTPLNYLTLVFQVESMADLPTSLPGTLISTAP
jgi:hypothetical protein